MSSRHITQNSSRKPRGSRTTASRSRFGVSRLSGSSRRNEGGSDSKNSGIKPLIFKNRNVTPQSLLSGKVREASSTATGGSRVAASDGIGDSAVSTGLDAADLPLDHLSSGLSRSALSVSSATGSQADGDEEDGFQLSTTLADDSIQESVHESIVIEAPVEELTAEDLEAPVTIQLAETETEFLFSMPSVMVLQDTEEHARVTARNEAYAQLVQVQAAGGDNSNPRYTQTLNYAQKNKDVTAAPPATRDAGITAASWDIIDASQAEDTFVGQDADLDIVAGKEAGSGDVDPRASMTDLERSVDEAVAASLASPGCLLDVEGTVMISPPVGWDEAVATEKSTAGRSRSGVDRSSNLGSTTMSRSMNTRGGSSRRGTSRAVSGISSGSRVGRSGDTRNASASTVPRRPRNGIIIPSAAAPDVVVGDGWSDAKDGRDVLLARESARVLASRSLLVALRTVERAIHQNIYHTAHRMYRAVPGTEVLMDGSAGGGEASEGPAMRLEKLWTYSCALTAGWNVSSMVWNRVNHDLLAVSYGQFDFADQKGGLILFWSMKNPEYPQCIIKTVAGVTALDFSVEHPNLLAAGLYDGTIAIFDVRKNLSGDSDGTPELMAKPLEGAHSDAVWQVKWVDKGDRGERLVSVSADGRVTEWSTKKGLVCANLMRLKRVRNTTRTGSDVEGDGVISRMDSGTCIDFPTTDTSLYFCGTEGGMMHHCSVSYNEQYLESYSAHTGPVNALHISPVLPHALLTCSADWSIRLWDIGSGEAPTVYQTTDAADSVNDVTWSLRNATRFASVTGDGRVQVWDTTSLTPLIDHRAEIDIPDSDKPAAAAEGDAAGAGGDVDSVEEEPAPTTRPKHFTKVLFAHNAPVLVTGDNSGCVDVYRLVGLPPPLPTIDEQAEALLASLHPA